MKTCPNCGFQSEPTDRECPKCGIIYEKWEAIGARKKEGKRKKMASEEEENSARILEVSPKCQKCGSFVDPMLVKCPSCGDLIRGDLSKRFGRAVYLGGLIIIALVILIPQISKLFEETSKENEKRELVDYETKHEKRTRAEYLKVPKSSLERELGVDGNGYDWNAATYEERLGVCKTICRRFGKDYMGWFNFLSEFYDTTDRSILNLKVAEVAAMGKVWSDHGVLDW